MIHRECEHKFPTDVFFLHITPKSIRNNVRLDVSGSRCSCLNSVLAMLEQTSNLKIALTILQIERELGHQLSVFSRFDGIEGGELFLRRHHTANLVVVTCNPNGSTRLKRWLENIVRSLNPNLGCGWNITNEWTQKTSIRWHGRLSVQPLHVTRSFKRDITHVLEF